MLLSLLRTICILSLTVRLRANIYAVQHGDRIVTVDDVTAPHVVSVTVSQTVIMV